MLADEVSDLIAEGEEALLHKRCAILVAIRQFEGLDRDSLIHLIDKTKVPAPRIVQLLAKHGVEVNMKAISYHRRRLDPMSNYKCACPVDIK